MSYAKTVSEIEEELTIAIEQEGLFAVAKSYGMSKDDILGMGYDEAFGLFLSIELENMGK